MLHTVALRARRAPPRRGTPRGPDPRSLRRRRGRPHDRTFRGSGPGPAETPAPTPTAVPGASDGSGNTGGGTDPGSGGGSGGNVGTGILPPGITFPGGAVPDESFLGEAKYLTPTNNLVNQRNASIQLVRAAIADDGKAFADLRWYSGVAPCNALDSVHLVKDDAAKTIHLTVVEGSGQGDQMCIEIAELHAVAVDLGVLASGNVDDLRRRRRAGDQARRSVGPRRVDPGKDRTCKPPGASALIGRLAAETPRRGTCGTIRR